MVFQADLAHWHVLLALNNIQLTYTYLHAAQKVFSSKALPFIINQLEFISTDTNYRSDSPANINIASAALICENKYTFK